jgi:hypothetical protein
MEAMSNANEEPLLTALLRELADADAHLTAPADLEARVLSRWERAGDVTISRAPRVSGARVMIAIAAVLLLFIAGSTRFDHTAVPTPVRTVVPTPGRAAPLPVDTATPTPSQITAELPDSAAVASVASRTNTIRRRNIPASPRRQIVEFVPLVPMTPGEMSGSFQIVRVQMPRAALGGLASRIPISSVDDPVQADLLLGEDGLARAIRVSTDGTAPWRSQ